jgi:TonB family protein
MAKIVKYCSACDEGFAEKFGFCPNCGQGLTAFEMKPVGETSAAVPEVMPIVETRKLVAIEEAIESKAAEVPNLSATEMPAKPLADSVPVTHLHKEPSHKVVTTEDSAKILPIKENTVVVASPVVTKQVAKDEFLEKETYGYTKTPAVSEYRPTFVEDKNGGVRGMLLTGALVLVTTLACGGWLYSLFARQLDVASLEEQVFVPNILSDVATIDEKEELEKNKESGGGGGGGGKKDTNPTSKGEVASQMEKPDFTPSATNVKLSNPDLKIVIATQGPAKREKPSDRYGDKNSTFEGISDGTGDGGGQGSGSGLGQGTGRGNGRGKGDGTGRGDGIGDGVGNKLGKGTGDDEEEPTRPTPTPAKPKKPAVTTALRIISQPRALYTDAARVAQTQGTVRLRVTFSANGSIANISPVSGLPNGLTEKAIEAARKISFTPKMEDGVPKAVTRVVDYSFTIH